MREPWWLYYAKLTKSMVDSAVAFLDIGRLATKLYTGISFAIDRALDAAYTTPSVSSVDGYTARISWTQVWADNRQNDKVYVAVYIHDESKYIYAYSTAVAVIYLKLEYVSYSPSLTWRLHPTSGTAYSSGTQPYLKSWMHRGVVDGPPSLVAGPFFLLAALFLFTYAAWR